MIKSVSELCSEFQITGRLLLQYFPTACYRYHLSCTVLINLFAVYSCAATLCVFCTALKTGDIAGRSLSKPDLAHLFSVNYNENLGWKIIFKSYAVNVFVVFYTKRQSFLIADT